MSQDVLIFQLSPLACALPCSLVSEIIPMAETIRLPVQPPLLEGFLNLRGDLMPIVSLRRLLALPIVPLALYTPIVLVRLADAQLGLCVDQVTRVEPINYSQLKPLPEEHSLNDCARGTFESEEQTVILLDGDRLFLVEERRRLEELRAEGKRRLSEIEASGT